MAASNLNDRLTTRLGYQQLLDRGIIKEWSDSVESSNGKEKGVNEVAEKMQDIVAPPLIKAGKQLIIP